MSCVHKLWWSCSWKYWSTLGPLPRDNTTLMIQYQYMHDHVWYQKMIWRGLITNYTFKMKGGLCYYWCLCLEDTYMHGPFSWFQTLVNMVKTTNNDGFMMSVTWSDCMIKDRGHQNVSIMNTLYRNSVVLPLNCELLCHWNQWNVK